MNIFDSIKYFWNTHIKGRLSATAALVIVVSLCLISLGYQYFRREDSLSISAIAGAVVVPFQEGVNSVGSFLFSKESQRLDLESARKRIEELEQENTLLKIEQEKNKDLVSENENLRSLLRAKERLSGYSMIEATVIGSENVNVFRRFTINRGSTDGIKVNMNVINGEGLIGFVSGVGLNYAVVTCITEEGVNVSAMTRNSQKNCIVTGSLELLDQGLLKLENALASVDFDSDSTLVTSDISDKYLPGLLIGYVVENNVDAGNLTRSGKVRCAVDFSDIREVLVITDMKEGTED